MFIAIGALNFVAAIAVPIALHLGGPGASGGLVLGDESDNAFLGRALSGIDSADPAMAAFFVAFMDTMCAFMMSFAVLQLGVAWFALRRAHGWALWASLLANVAIAPYYLVIAWTFALQGAPVIGGVVGALFPLALAGVATVIGGFGIRHINRLSAHGV